MVVHLDEGHTDTPGPVWRGQPGSITAGATGSIPTQDEEMYTLTLCELDQKPLFLLCLYIYAQADVQSTTW